MKRSTSLATIWGVIVALFVGKPEAKTKYELLSVAPVSQPTNPACVLKPEAKSETFNDDFQVWDIVLWNEYNIEITVVQIFKTTIAGMWIYDGKLCRGSIYKSDCKHIPESEQKRNAREMMIRRQYEKT